MQWTSEAIVIKQQAFNDDKSLCWIFSATNGLYKGLFTLNKKARSQIQIGSITISTWKARLPEHLGNYYCELLKPLSMAIINNNQKLSSVVSICDILSYCLPEKVPEEKIYDHLISYLLALKDNKNWVIDYLKLELTILKELGYGLHLESCALTGSKDNLYYVSPKTGMSASKEAGAQYHNKLLILPRLFADNVVNKQEEIVAGLKFTAHFLQQSLYKPHNIDLPLSRKRFANLFEINS